MDFKSVLAIISTDINGQTKLEVNWTQVDHFSLQKATKWPYLKVPFCPSVNNQKACLLLLHFSMNLSETLRIDVNMDFANNNHLGSKFF